MEFLVTSLVEEYKAGKVRTVMMLRYSKDQGIREDPPEVRTGRKWSVEQEVDRAEIVLRHRDIVVAVQTGRLGLGVNSFKPFSTSTDKENRDAVVAEVRRQEQEKGRLHLVKCT